MEQDVDANSMYENERRCTIVAPRRHFPKWKENISKFKLICSRLGNQTEGCLLNFFSSDTERYWCQLLFQSSTFQVSQFFSYFNPVFYLLFTFNLQ